MLETWFKTWPSRLQHNTIRVRTLLRLVGVGELAILPLRNHDPRGALALLTPCIVGAGMLECLGAVLGRFWTWQEQRKHTPRASRICLEHGSTGSLPTNNQSAMHLVRSRISISKQLRMSDGSSNMAPFLYLGQ